MNAEVKIIISDVATGEVLENFVATTQDDVSNYKLAARVREAIEQYEETIRELDCSEARLLTRQ